MNNSQTNGVLESQLFSYKSLEGSFPDMSKYLDKLENKYKRALKIIEENVAARQQVEAENIEVKS